MSFFKSIFKNYPYLTLFSLFLFLFFLIFNVFSWTIPQDNPPNSNLPAPLNVSSQEQTKEGNLNINGLLRLGRFTSHPTGTNGALYYNTADNKFYGYSNGSWQELGSGAGGGLWALSNNNIYNTNSGNVGVGTTDPTAKLYIKTTDTTTIPFQVEALVSPPLPGWSYRRPITISNSAGALTNYQVLVTLNTQSLISAGKMRSDCGDIRFTDSDGSTLLNYWLESGCNTASTKIWVKVPSIPASSTKTIYVYYGNPSATSLSNGDATFDYFDLGDKFTTWTQGTYACSQDTSTGNSAPSYKCPSGSGYYMYKNINLVPGTIMTFNVRSNGLGNLYFLVNYAGAGQMYRLDTRGGTNYSGFATTNSWTSWNLPSSGFTATANAWYKLTIVITSSTSATLYYSQTTDASPTGFGTLLGTYTITNNGGYIGLVGDGLGTSYSTWWDNIIARKYTSPEPTTSVGAEQQQPPPQQQTVFYIQNQTGNVGIGTTNPTYTLHVNGSFAATTKNFEINHPTKPGKKLVHACIEGPEAALFYRGEGKLIEGKAIIELPDYFEALTRKEDRTVQLTAKGTKPYLLSASEVKDGKFMVYGTEPDGEFYWEVKAVRADVEPLQVEK